MTRCDGNGKRRETLCAHIQQITKSYKNKREGSVSERPYSQSVANHGLFTIRHQDDDFIPQSRKVIDYNLPHNIICYRIISVDDTIACRDYGPGIGDLDVRMFLDHAINGFSDDGDITLYGTTQHQIAPILFELFWNFLKERIDLINRSLNVKQICLKMSVHKSFALSHQVPL